MCGREVTKLNSCFADDDLSACSSFIGAIAETTHFVS